MIKFYKVEMLNTLLVVDTLNRQAAPFHLESKPYHDLNSLLKWWSDKEVSDFCTCSYEALVTYIIRGIEEIK